MNHNEFEKNNYKTGDMITLTVTIFKQNIIFIGEFINLGNECVNINIGVGDQICSFPLSNIKTSEYLFRNSKSDLYTETNNIESILGIYKSEISFTKLRNASGLKNVTGDRNRQQYFIDDDIKILNKEFRLILTSNLLTKVFNCNICSLVSKYANVIYNKIEEEKTLISSSLCKQLRNNLNIPSEFIDHYKKIVMLSAEIINDLNYLASVKEIDRLIKKTDEALSITKNNLFNVLKRLKYNLTVLSTCIINFLLINLERVKISSNVADFKELFLKRIFDITFLQLRMEKLIDLDLFSKLLPDNSLINNKGLNYFKLKYKIRLTYYLLAYSFLVECKNNDFELYVKFITNKLLNILKHNTDDLEKNASWDNSSFGVYIPFVYKNDADIKRFIILLMFAVNESGFLNLKFGDCNDYFYESIRKIILSEYVSNNYLSLNEAINNIIYNNIHIYINSVDCCNKIRLSLINYDITNVCNEASDLKNILEKYGSKFLFVFPENCEKVLLFLERLIEITKKDNLNFEYREHLLSKSRDYCDSLIAIHVDDYFTFYVYNCLSQLNDYTHSNVFSDLFYRRFVPEISLSLHEDFISFNDRISALILPLTIHSDSNRQCPEYGYLYVYSNLSGDSLTVDLSQELFRVNNDVNIIVKIPFKKFNPNLLSQLNTDNSSDCAFNPSIFSGRVINVTVEFELNYRYKSKFDFETHTPVFKDSICRFSKSFKVILPKPFIRIRNEFKNYKNGSVVEDERMFFGRDSTIREVLEYFLNANGDLIPGRCVCLYGQTRTGKSTLSFHLRKKLEQNPNIIVVNFGDIGSITNFEIYFKYNFISTVLDTIELGHSDLYDYLTSVNFSFSINSDLFKEDPNTYFNNFMSSLSSKIYKSKLKKQIIVVLDEFTYVYDWIRNGELSCDFMRTFKSFLQNFNVSALLIGQDHTPQFINDVRFTGYFNSIIPLELNYLSENDSSLLISKPVSKEWCGDEYCTFDSDCISFLYSFTAGSPYILMNLCSDFVDYLNELQTRSASIAHVEDFINRYLTNIQEILFEPLYCDKLNYDSDVAIKRNKKLLTLIATNLSSSGYADIDRLNLSESDRCHLSYLSQRNIVDILNNSCRIKVRMYSEWLKRMNRRMYESR